jgi:hypothetical protein
MISIQNVVPIAVVTATDPIACRPTAYRERYIGTRPVPYHFVQSSTCPASSGGVLRAGQAIWLEQKVDRKRLPASVQAFVENVGFVLLDPHVIKHGDGSLLRS